jgi:hypothetical protein
MNRVESKPIPLQLRTLLGLVASSAVFCAAAVWVVRAKTFEEVPAAVLLPLEHVCVLQLDHDRLSAFALGARNFLAGRHLKSFIHTKHGAAPSWGRISVHRAVRDHEEPFDRELSITNGMARAYDTAMSIPAIIQGVA